MQHSISRERTYSVSGNYNGTPFSEIRNLEIDGLRGAAVLLVLVWHFIGAIISPDLGIVARATSAILIFGRTGVDLFFVISGFLIIGILVDRRNCSNYFRVFFVRRALRILPPYCVLMLVFWVTTTQLPENSYFGSQIPWWSYATFTQNWFIILLNSWGPSASSVTWSVAIEEQFYLLFPTVVFFTPRRYLPVLLVSVGATSALARAGCYIVFPQNLFAPYVATVLRLDGLCAGGLLALFIRDPELSVRLLKHRLNIDRFGLALLASIPLFLIALRWNAPATMYYWGHTYLTILYSTLLAVALFNKEAFISKILRGRMLRELGRISYGVYLFHPMFIGFAFILNGKKEELNSMLDVAVLSAALVITLGFSIVSYQLMEAKLLALGRKFEYSATAAT